MDTVISFLNANPILSLFVIIASGIALGNISLRGFSFGSSAVIFTGILFGHLGAKLPEEINTLGVILFVYAIGLQAGPRFFRTIYRHWASYFIIAATSLLAGVMTVWAFVKMINIDAGLGIGIFPGALTSTPGLAAALEANQDPNISIGYGVAYPFGVIGVVLFVQIIAMMKKTAIELQKESEQSKDFESTVCVKQFLVTNPNFTGKSLVEIDLHSMTQANITRIKHGDKISMAHADSELYLNDVVRAVGTPRELRKLEHLIGSETEAPMDTSFNLVSRDVFISSPHCAGKTISQLEIHSLYGVILTRLQRDEMEITPTGRTMLEIGDLVRVVGDKEDCEHFVKIFGQAEKRIHETNLLPLTIGIVLGGILGSHY
ncbi:MAG: TrkA C-terminal domain-containing protein, partial [Candidatus Hinthialibacter sp.]